MMRFLLIWVLEIMVFISFGILFMAQLPQFQNMQDATFFVIQGIWGQWNIWGYIGPGTVSNLQYLGVIYQYFFQLMNQILMLNLVIAILGSVYSGLMKLQNGLYFDELIMVIADMDWHDQYGCIVCVQTPFQWLYILIVPIL